MRKFFSIFFSLAFVLGLLPGLALTAWARDGEGTEHFTTQLAAGENPTLEDDKLIIDWTITYNPEATVSAAGTTVTDEIAMDARSYMKLHGDSITVTKYDGGGNQVGNPETIRYWDLVSCSDYDWTYMVPESDSKAYMYVITCQTEVDQRAVNVTAETQRLRNYANGTLSYVDVEPIGGKLSLTVSHGAYDVSAKTMEWTATIRVPGGGLAWAELAASLPATWINGQRMIDTCVGATVAEGLKGDESYTIDDSGVNDTQDPKVTILFYKDSDKQTPGLRGGIDQPREIKVKITTNVNQEWLTAEMTAQGWSAHTLNARMNNTPASDTLLFGTRPHIHSLAYTVGTGEEANAITATCTADGCTDPAFSATLTISAPLHATYGDGNDPAAVITDEDGIQGDASVSYYRADASGSRIDVALPGAPADPGSYWAEITLGAEENAATAHVVYTIAKAETQVTTVPTASVVTCGEALSTSTLSGGKAKSGETVLDGSFAWKNPTEEPAVTGNYTAVFTPTDARYEAAEVDVPVTVQYTIKAAASPENGGTVTLSASAATAGTWIQVTPAANDSFSWDSASITAVGDTSGQTYWINYFAVQYDAVISYISGSFQMPAENVTVTVRFDVCYPITTTVTGDFGRSYISVPTSAKADDTVQIGVSSIVGAGYSASIMTAATCTAEDGTIVPTTQNANGYSFVMPAQPVRVEVTTKAHTYYMKSLTVSGGTLEPAFDPQTTEYTVTAPAGATEVGLSLESEYLLVLDESQWKTVTTKKDYPNDAGYPNAASGTVEPGRTITAEATGCNGIFHSVNYYITVVSHQHDWAYTAEGAALTATCRAAGCTDPAASATLTIVKPTLAVAGGTGSPAASLEGLSDFNTATGLAVSEEVIRYYKAKKDGDTYTKKGEPLGRAPVKGGDYVAEITVGDGDKAATAAVGYTIDGAEVEMPGIVAHSLVLDGSIGVRFYVEFPEGLSVDTDTCEMSFRLYKEDKERTVTYADCEKVYRNGKELYVFTCHVNAVQMADTITAKLHFQTVDEDGNVSGDEQVVSEEYSVRKYIQGFQANEDLYSAKMRMLVQALADYGHYAQIYLSETRGWTLGTEEEDPDHVAMDDYGYATTEYSAADKAEARNGVAGKAISVTRSSKIEKVSCSLSLDSDTSVSLYFTPVSSYKGSASATLDGKDVAVAKSGGRFKVVIPSIPAPELGDLRTVRLTTGGRMTTVRISALSYANAILRSSKKDTEINAMTAFYRYCAAATEVFKG